MSPYVNASGRTYHSFTKSSRSTGGANCVEIGIADDGTIAIRDSKDPTGPVIEIAPGAFRRLVTNIKAGTFDPQ
jgi:hypothetical protein